MVPDTLKNSLLFYDYDIQDSDTPEIIAYKYYGDSYRYWMVLFANEIMDPQWEWPMDAVTFNNYMSTNYPDIDPNMVNHHYTQRITTTDNTTLHSTTDEIIISKDTYDTLAETSRNYTLPSGYTATVMVEKFDISVYEYEFNLNESKRSIKLINEIYADQLEKEFKSLMMV
jgi:hypothetical protein